MNSGGAKRTVLSQRIVRIDDLLHIAARASTSLDILTANRDANAHRKSPLSEAIQMHLGIAEDPSWAHGEEDDYWAVRGQAKLHAARIAQLSHAMKEGMPHLAVVDHDPTALYFDAMQEFRGCGPVRDLTLEIVTMHEYIQSVRLGGKYEAAGEMASLAPGQFSGTGTEMYRAMFELEHTIARLQQTYAGTEIGPLEEAREFLAQTDDYWRNNERAQYWASGRGRHEFARGLLEIHDGKVGNALDHLREARRYLGEPGWDGMRSVERLSMAFAVAECSAANRSVGDPPDEILTACDDAVSEIEKIRSRWGVVARSPIAPAAVLRIVLGELARLVSRISAEGGADAGRLGLRIALIAKQSGYAELVRVERSLLDDSLGVLVEEIVKHEQMQDEHPETDVERQYLEDLSADLRHASSPLLADIVLPPRVDVAPILESARRRGCIMLDFVQLPLAYGGETWFRTTIENHTSVVFEELTLGVGYEILMIDDGTPAEKGLIDRLGSELAGGSDGWALAARELLPEPILRRLRGVPSGGPPELLISPHKNLGRVPWSALVVDVGAGDRRIRLVERAVVAQIPMLSTLLADRPQPVTGTALIWLAEDVANRQEQFAWGMPAGTLTAACEISAATGDARRVSLGESLAPQRWALSYVACHGSGNDLRQYINVGERLTAAQALSLPWPPNVVLAACHVGRYEDSGEGEPLGFVIAAMVGGARTVVAGLNVVSDAATGVIGRRLIERLDGRTRLDHALREAQLQYLEQTASTDRLWEWALLAAFVR